MGDYYTYIFAVGMVLAFADAYGIGSNDVANAFSTAVSSKTITLLQACVIATFTEFGGAVLLGAEVADTIKDKIIKTDVFKQYPGAMMLGFLCALLGSSFWVNLASHMGWPVSTTHSIIGAIIGFGVASGGGSSVNWGYQNKGVASIVTSWVISPCLAAVGGAIIFLLTKYGIMRHSPEKSYKYALWVIPVYFIFTFAIETLFIVWKGSPRLKLSNLAGWKIAVIVLSVSLGLGFLSWLFLVPWLRRRIEKKEDLRWYHIPVVHCVRRPCLEDTTNALDEESSGDMKKDTAHDDALEEGAAAPQSEDIVKPNDHNAVEPAADAPAPAEAQPEKKKPNFLLKLILPVKTFIVKGYTAEVANYHHEELKRFHDIATQYDSRAESVFQALQVLTSSLASFAHGSNDVANAIGPISAIYYVWENAKVPPSKVPVEIWLLAYGGAAIVIGLWTYGFKVMRSLGNQITYHSPSRGFSMELGATLTVLVASKVGIPVSSTHCITGATIGVGLCNGKFNAVNWKRVLYIFSGWIVTLPVAGLISGLSFAFIINAPRMY